MYVYIYSFQMNIYLQGKRNSASGINRNKSWEAGPRPPRLLRLEGPAGASELQHLRDRGTAAVSRGRKKVQHLC
jgi:hypothetical protein